MSGEIITILAVGVALAGVDSKQQSRVAAGRTARHRAAGVAAG